MIDTFRDFIIENKLFSSNDKILLTISGGIDSIVMLHLFVNAGYNCGVAHCNFHLRGNESDGDEEFVANLSEKYQLPYHKVDFETEKYASENKLSVQMAARNLRYQWFEEIRQSCGYDYIAIAHQKDDEVETFFINLTRGTGIHGLTGIKCKTGKIVRPLLFATRDEIVLYAAGNKFNYREDSSNKSVKYMRNKIRHIILPAFNQMNLNFNNTVLSTIEHLKDTETIFNLDIQKKWDYCIIQDNSEIKINISRLKELKPLKTYLFEFLYPYNFSIETVCDIINSLDSQPGLVFLSSSHRIVLDREYLIMNELCVDDLNLKSVTIKTGTKSIETEDYVIFMKNFERPPNFTIPRISAIACLDADKLKSPLILRNWEPGDSFTPLGMKGKKKLSDFLTDIKLSLPEKEKVKVITSENQIIWIVGYRIDDRYKISNSTKRIVMFEKQ